MKRLTISAVLSAAFLMAQRGPYNAATMSPYRAMPPLVGATPGNILQPGGTPMLHPTRLGRTISGAAPYPVAPGTGGHGRNRTVVVPYAVPVWSGGYYGYGMQPKPNVTVVMPEQPAPSIVINHHYNSPDAGQPVATTIEQADRGGLRVYEATPPKPAAKPQAAPSNGTYVRDEKPNIYTLVLEDGTARQAIGYWVEGNLLKYVTPQATIGSVPLDAVNRDATQKVNAQNKLEVDLPPMMQ